jgi:hypothetical protein
LWRARPRPFSPAIEAAGRGWEWGSPNEGWNGWAWVPCRGAEYHKDNRIRAVLLWRSDGCSLQLFLGIIMGPWLNGNAGSIAVGSSLLTMFVRAAPDAETCIPVIVREGPPLRPTVRRVCLPKGFGGAVVAKACRMPERGRTGIRTVSDTLLKALGGVLARRVFP